MSHDLVDYSNSWDPLEAAAETDKEIAASAKKREIRNILKSYVGTYDPMSELIQNAMDAVDRRRQDESTDEEYIPRLFIRIDLQENSFEVADNGCGFNELEFKAFMAPNISFKSGGGTRGNKGVGATYIAYGFNSLELRTKSDGFTYKGRFVGGRDWVEDRDGTVGRPQVKIVNEANKSFDALDQGTLFKITFGGKKTRPTNLGWYQAQTAEQWLYLLLVRTPLGHIMLPKFDESDIKFELEIVNSNGELDRIEDCACRYKFPHLEIKASQSLSAIREVQMKAVEKSRDPTKAIEKYRNSNGVFETFSAERLKASVAILDEEELNLIDEFDVQAYGYFAYSTAIWDQLNDKKAKLRKGYRILRGGLQLANNGMVQGDMITIPLTRSIGHQNQAHILVHFTDADPDLGRKGFQPELKELAEKISVYIVGQLAARRDVLKGDSGTAPDIEKEVAVHDWVRQQEDHETASPLVLKNENFFLPTRKISIQSTPVSEQDVIVLFNQLVAGGVIRGVKLLATSQVAQYDGVFRYAAEEPLENLVFDEGKNPLGVHDEQLLKPYLGPPQILEYKFSLDGLIREFESEAKYEKDIALAVFWEMGEEYKKEYSAISLLDFENIHHRRHHGVTHVLKSANTSFSVICLKELIALLNDPSGQQEFQRFEYGDEI